MTTTNTPAPATRRKLGLALPLEAPAVELLGVARDAEALGYDVVWVNDDRLAHDPVTLLGALARETRTLQLGPGVTNPYSRHPALLATAMATLDELSEGRAVLGLGAGGTNHRALGIRREAPATALREAVTLLRGLWAGERVTLEGRVVRAGDAQLDFTVARPDIPIFIGARGPRMLELAGEVADGVIVGNVATVTGWEYALGRIGAGAERTGRRLDDLSKVAWFYASVDDDAEAALDAVRPMVATSLVTSRPVLGDLGIEMPADFAAAMEARDWRVDRATVSETGRLLAPDIVRRFAIAGTPEDCRRSITELLAAVPGIDQVSIVPFAPRHGSAATVARRFAEEVAPQVLGMPAAVEGASA